MQLTTNQQEIEMPKRKLETVTTGTDGWDKVDRIVQGKPFTYNRPTVTTFAELAEYDGPARDVDWAIADEDGPSEKETMIDWLYRVFSIGLDRKLVAAATERAASESTKIKVGTDTFDLMEFPQDRLLRFINRMYENIYSQTLMSYPADHAKHDEAFKALAQSTKNAMNTLAARRKILAEGFNGTTYVVKMNDEAGYPEVVPVLV
jgi:hypothetical protein